MPTIHLAVVRKADPPPWPDLATARLQLVHEGTAWRLSVLEAGMQSGEPSVGLVLPMPDGSWMVAETSLAAWISVTAAMRGAFPEAFEGTALERRQGPAERPQW